MKVILIKPLTLAGREHRAGESVDVSPSIATWLAAQQIIAGVPVTTTTTTRTGKAGSQESAK